MIDIESRCTNGDFCHNQGICQNFSNGTTKCDCFPNSYGERCQFLSDDYKKREIPPTFPNLDGKDGTSSYSHLKQQRNCNVTLYRPNLYNSIIFYTFIPEICCRSMHARCIACSYGKSIDEFCSDPNNKDIVGCEGKI